MPEALPSPDGVGIYQLTAVDSAGVTGAIVVPEWGAGVFGLCYRLDGWSWPLPVLEAVDIATVATSPTSFGMPLLAPTPGRVGRSQSGEFTFEGEHFTVSPTRHGLVRQRPWRVLSASATEIVCAVEVAVEATPGEEAFPFRFRAEHRIQLEPGCLRSRLILENRGERAQPLNCGWHPYLHRGGPCRVKIPAGARWELDGEAEPTPTGRIVPLANGESLAHGRPLLPAEHWDDVLTDIDFRSGAARSWIEEDESVLTRSGEMLPVRVRRFVEIPSEPEIDGRPAVRNVQLYTPPGRRAISIEPLSAPPDAINISARGHERADVCAVAPGDRVEFEITVGIEVEPI